MKKYISSPICTRLKEGSEGLKQMQKYYDACEKSRLKEAADVMRRIKRHFTDQNKGLKR